MLRNFTLCFTLLACSLLGAQAVGFVGACGGQDQRWGVDVALAQQGVGASSWGVHVAGIGRSEGQKLPDSYYTSKAPGTYTVTTESSGFQLGFYQDMGRAWWALGAETLKDTQRTYTVAPDRTWSAQAEVNRGGSGAYVKFGLKAGIVSIYGGFGSKTKAVAGLAVHF